MPLTKERFDSGLTYQQYKEQMTRNRERFDEVEKQIKVTPELEGLVVHTPENQH